MAGTLIVSNLTTDTDNTFIVRSNTGTTLFSANTTGIDVANSIGATAITNDKILSVANTKISGLVTASQIANVANTQLTGTLIASQIASVNATTATSGTLPTARLPTGTVLQVSANSISTSQSTTSSSHQNSTLTANITPSNSSNKILVSFSFVGGGNYSGRSVFYALYKNGSQVFSYELFLNTVSTIPLALTYLDSPATTSSTTYALYFRTDGLGTAYVSVGNAVSTIVLQEIAG